MKTLDIGITVADIFLFKSRKAAAVTYAQRIFDQKITFFKTQTIWSDPRKTFLSKTPWIKSQTSKCTILLLFLNSFGLN